MESKTLEIPVFPLPDVVLFPNTRLPLHVFEPRYKQMIADCLAGDKMLAIAQLKPGWREDYYGAPPVYRVVGVGRIVEHVDLEGGRYDIVVEGVARGTVVREQMRGPYRIATVETVPDIPPSDPQVVETYTRAMKRLLHRIAIALPEFDLTIRPGLMSELHPGIVADLIAHVLVDDPYERQSLLAEPDVTRRVQLARIRVRAMLRPS